MTISSFVSEYAPGYPKETPVRFLKAREWNVSKAHKMVTVQVSQQWMK